MKYLDSGIKKLAELNLFNFCSLFSSKINLNNGLDLFYNELVKKDYFFNSVHIKKTKTKQSLNEVFERLNEYKRAKKKSWELYIYLDESLLQNNEILNENLIKIDKMILLKSPDEVIIKKQLNSEFYQTTIDASFDKNFICNWIKTFCSIFGLPQLRRILPTIIINNQDNLLPITLNLKTTNTRKSHTAGCGMLFDDGLSMGLYCLGTVANFRNIGIGKRILNFGLSITKSRGYKYFTLQTFANDNILDYYTHMGFTIINKKEIILF